MKDIIKDLIVGNLIELMVRNRAKILG